MSNDAAVIEIIEKLDKVRNDIDRELNKSLFTRLHRRTPEEIAVSNANTKHVKNKTYQTSPKERILSALDRVEPKKYKNDDDIISIVYAHAGLTNDSPVSKHLVELIKHYITSKESVYKALNNSGSAEDPTIQLLKHTLHARKLFGRNNNVNEHGLRKNVNEHGLRKNIKITLSNLIELYVQQGKLPEAIHFLRHELKHTPTEDTPYIGACLIHLAEVYIKMDNIKSAMEALKILESVERNENENNYPTVGSLHNLFTRHHKGGYTKKAMTPLCPPGQVLRFGFAIKSKTRKLCAPGIGKLKEGQLAKFGYVNVVHKTVEARRAALDKAVKEFGALSVFRKLNAVYVYGRRSAKESSKIFKEDRDWVKGKYM